MEPNKVPFEYCHRWLVCSLKIGERNYTLFLICGLIMYITSFIVSVIPFVGAIASLMLSFIFTLAGMRLTQFILKNPEAKADIDTYLKFAFDPDYFNRFRTQLAILFVAGVISLSSTYLRFISFTFVTSAVIFLVTYLVSISAFMIIQNPDMHWQKALEKVFQGFTLNLGSWLCAFILLGAFAVVSLLLCFVPFLLYFVPMTFSVGYLIYASVFENVDIESLITEWGSKTTVQTHTLPPEA
jgi:hypothetical protein